MNNQRKMKTLVLKFGGASVATPACFDRIADIVSLKAKLSQRLAIVVSAMGNTTNELIKLAEEVNPDPPIREFDMLVSVGERISISLLAMALAKRGLVAKSFTGSQSGIVTTNKHSEAKIVEVRPKRVIQAFDDGNIVIVAGFQGVSREGEITTLGRGGSDTSAVALGIALHAECVEFYKDVSGIFSDDPKQNSNAIMHSSLSYIDALNIVKGEALILHSRCIELAKKNGMKLHVRSFLNDDEGTIIKGESVQSNQPVYEVEIENKENSTSGVSKAGLSGALGR